MRALGRLAWFVVGSWLVTAGALAGILSPFPYRWKRTAPHIARWARLGARCLGVRVTVVGAPPPAGSLVVANHQGYADIVTIGGLTPCIFAARHDMRRWPLLGVLARLAGTVFINRDKSRESYRGVAQVTAALKAGATVIAFPEGTSTDGTGLLPFRTGIFQPAVDAACPVAPAAIVYRTLDGEPVTDANRDMVGWFRGEPFLGHLLRLAGIRRVDAEVRFGPTVEASCEDRKTLARKAEAAVRELLGVPAGAYPREVGRTDRTTPPAGAPA